MSTYLRAGGPWYVAIIFIFCILYGGCLVSLKLWLSAWSNDVFVDVYTAKEKSHLRLAVYGTLVIALGKITPFMWHFSISLIKKCLKKSLWLSIPHPFYSQFVKSSNYMYKLMISTCIWLLFHNNKSNVEIKYESIGPLPWLWNEYVYMIFFDLYIS